MRPQDARLRSPWSPPDNPVSQNCLSQLPLAPKSGCRQATPKLHTTLGHSCRPSEAKSTFHKTRPHPQVGSQPLIWKKSDLLVLSSSKSTSTAHLVPALVVCLSSFIFRASRARESTAALPLTLGHWPHVGL